MTGKHIKELSGFEGVTACNRRLKILVDNKFIKRRKILYGFPYLYTLTHKSRMLLNLNKREERIRLDLLRHDILVIDVLIFLMKQKKIKLEDITTEKELHQSDGFSTRTHKPDFSVSLVERVEKTERTEKKKIAVEIELSLKALERLRKNVRDNFMNYDSQLWYIEFSSPKLFKTLQGLKTEYPNIQILNIEDINRRKEVSNE
ncbi:MAG: replication-relaxation family protein [Oscillospiraceae bacterium]|nr:replication-relaxation family protein [Oscillospiraceae bacterium]